MTLKIFAASSLLALSMVSSVSSAQVAEEYIDSNVEASVEASEAFLASEDGMTDYSLRDRRPDRGERRAMFQCSAHGVRNDRRLFYGDIYPNQNRAARSAMNVCLENRNRCVIYECRRVR